MKKNIIKLVIIFSISFYSCGNKETTEEKKIMENLSGINSIDFAPKDSIHFKYLPNYFSNSFKSYKNKEKEELRDELEFLDLNIAFFEYDKPITNESIDSIYRTLYIKAFQPSDEIYFVKTCAPKYVENTKQFIANYGEVFQYNFSYQSKPACQMTKPTLIINSQKKEVIIIESMSTEIQNNGKIMNITFSTRGNESIYSLKFNGKNFVYIN